MILSTCCSAPYIGDEVDPLCTECKEHTELYDDE
jgi:hypothetical protein